MTRRQWAVTLLAFALAPAAAQPVSQAAQAVAPAGCEDAAKIGRAHV